MAEPSTSGRETPHPGEQGSPSYGGVCPMCGQEYDSRLPDHFRTNCPEVSES